MWSKFAAVLTSIVGLLTVVPGTAGAASETTSTSVMATHLVLPDPTGSEQVGTVSLHLVDRSRSGPWVPNKSVREIMIQIWYPGRSVRPYPVAPWVEFPAGRIGINTLQQPTDPADEARIIAKALETRVADTRFTLNQLAVPWAQLRGQRYLLQLVGSGHMSFTDYQVLLSQAGVPPEVLVPAFGTIDAERSIAVQCAYVRTFFDRHMCRGRVGKLLAGPSPRHPEMRFVA